MRCGRLPATRVVPCDRGGRHRKGLTVAPQLECREPLPDALDPLLQAIETGVLLGRVRELDGIAALTGFYLAHVPSDPADVHAKYLQLELDVNVGHRGAFHSAARRSDVLSRDGGSTIAAAEGSRSIEVSLRPIGQPWRTPRGSMRGLYCLGLDISHS